MTPAVEGNYECKILTRSNPLAALFPRKENDDGHMVIIVHMCKHCYGL